MQLGLGLGIRRRDRVWTPTERLASWVSRVVINGGTVSAGTQAAVLAFLTSVNNLGLLTRIKRLNLFAGSNLAACLTPQITDGGAAVDINTNFVEGDYTENLGLASGSTRWLNTGLAFPSGAILGGFSLYCSSSLTATNIHFIGATQGSTSARFNKTVVGSEQVSVFGEAVAGTFPEVSVAFQGFWRATRKSSIFNRLSKDGAGNTAVGENTANLPTIPIYVFARNLNGVASGIVASSARWSGYAIDDGTIPDANETAFRTAWNTYNTAMGR